MTNLKRLNELTNLKYYTTNKLLLTSYINNLIIFKISFILFYNGIERTALLTSDCCLRGWSDYRNDCNYFSNE